VGGAEVSLDISVGDYTMDIVAIFDAHTGRGPAGEFLFFWTKSYLTVVQERVWATGCSPGIGGG
jgi:hypothetical protein